MEKVTLPEGLETIESSAFSYTSLVNVLLPGSVTEIGNSAFLDCSSLETIWGKKNSAAETYAASAYIAFKAIGYPYIDGGNDPIKPGNTSQFTAKVYTGVGESTSEVSWSVQGATSDMTKITAEGLLFVAEEERSKELTITASYGKESASAKVEVTVAPVATFTGDISRMVTADGENRIFRPEELEETSYRYEYYRDGKQIADSEWPLKIDGDITIEVIRKEIRYQITYHLDGGENAPENPAEYSAVNPYVKLLDASREHYEFLGWYLDAKFKTEATEETALSGDIDLYAKWQGALCTITFDVNGGSRLEETTKEVRYGSKIGALKGASRENYAFLGWFTEAEDGEKVESNLICNGNLTLYAHWSKIAEAHDHTYESEVIQEATCTEGGIRKYTCSKCGDSYEEATEALGHGKTELRDVVEATTEREGYTGNRYCTVCGALLEEGTVIERLPEAHEHEYQSTVEEEPTCTENGLIRFMCSCGSTYTEEIEATGHRNTEVRDEKEATCTEKGYTGNTYCKDCGEKLSSGKATAKLAHKWDAGKVTKKATTTTTGIRTYTCTKCKATKKETIPKVVPKKATPGKTVKDTASNGVYKVLKDGLSVTFVRPLVKKATVKIPETVKVSGVKCKVTEIATNAFKNNSILRTVVIGKNVTAVGVNAFYRCGKLVKVSGGAGLAKIGDRAFYNCASLPGIVLPTTVTSIGKQAFYNCKKLSSITVKTLALMEKKIGAQAFTGTYAKVVVKVPTKKYAAYKKLLCAKGMSTKAVYKKL